MNLDQFLNTAIPILLITIAVGWVWFKFKEPLGAFFSWIGDLFSGIFSDGKDKVKTSVDGSYEIVYR